MDVGIYLDLRNPPGWRQDWRRVYGFALELVQEAERLGAASVWLSEHHLFPDGYLTQPLTLAAAIAARTSTIRIGTAVVVAPFRNPVQLAEEATVVDLVSAGRLELGLGAGYRQPEYALFGADPARRYTDTDRTVRRLREIWADPAHLPPPVQDRPPIWLGYAGPRGARRAGLLGEGLLTLDRAMLAPYRQGLAGGGHDVSSARVAGPVFAYVTDRPDEDWPVVARHHAYQLDTYRRGMAEGTDRPSPRPADSRAFRERGLAAGLNGLGYGTPEQVAGQVRAHCAGLPVRHVFLMVSLAGMPEDMVVRHLHTICGRLAPLLAGGPA